ncbi:hypothetical protein Tco_1195688 [Tanacetum coccineum]
MGVTMVMGVMVAGGIGDDGDEVVWCVARRGGDGGDVRRWMAGIFSGGGAGIVERKGRDVCEVGTRL